MFLLISNTRATNRLQLKAFLIQSRIINLKGHNMINEQTIRTILRIMPPVTIRKQTGIDIYLIDAHQKYNEPLELTSEQQRTLDE